jgi:hypothetical protein
LQQDTAGFAICITGPAGAAAALSSPATGSELHAANDGEFLFLLEKDLTIELQKLRRELYFIHAAALTIDGKACLLLAPSGHGKSTTCWGLLHHGFGYLSDELAPLDLGTLEIQPYAHALCLKDEPPACYPLPPGSAADSNDVARPGGVIAGKRRSGAANGAVFPELPARSGRSGDLLYQQGRSGNAPVRPGSQSLGPCAGRTRWCRCHR